MKTRKNRTQIFIVFGLSIKFFLGVQSTQFYNKTSTSKICLETNESLLSPSRCQPRKPPESPFQGTILCTCYWVICHFFLCPEAWKWKTLTFIMCPENLSVILNSCPQSKMLGLHNVGLSKVWSSSSNLPLRFAALCTPWATFLCLSPSLNSIKGQAYNFMSSNFDVSKPSPWIPFHTYLTPNRATFQNSTQISQLHQSMPYLLWLWADTSTF